MQGSRVAPVIRHLPGHEDGLRPSHESGLRMKEIGPVIATRTQYSSRQDHDNVNVFRALTASLLLSPALSFANIFIVIFK